MAVEQSYVLRWNDFHTNLSQGFSALLDDEDLMDVTLAAGGQYFQAHKIVLSVSSPYFKELFKSNPCDHPIVIMRDVKPTELQQLLHFMYKGEVNVHRDDITPFIHTASMLQVKGLTATGLENTASQKPASPVPDDITMNENVKEELSTSEDTSTNDLPNLYNDNLPTLDNDIARPPLERTPTMCTLKPAKMNHTAKKKQSQSPVDNVSLQQDSFEYSSDGELHIYYDERNHGLLQKPKQESGWNCKTGGVQCPSCNRYFANRYNLKVHIRDKHDTKEGTLKCEICDKRMRNPSCLRVHLYHHRKQAAFLAAQMSNDPSDAKMTIGMPPQLLIPPEWKNEPSSPLAAANFHKSLRMSIGMPPELVMSTPEWKSEPTSPPAAANFHKALRDLTSEPCDTQPQQVISTPDWPVEPPMADE